MENQYQRKHFKEGDEVAHKENPQLKMEVTKIVRKSKKIAGASPQEFKLFTLGIECGWWKDDEFRTAVFHTKSLVPFEIAEQGHIEIIKYLSSKPCRSLH